MYIAAQAYYYRYRKKWLKEFKAALRKKNLSTEKMEQDIMFLSYISPSNTLIL